MTAGLLLTTLLIANGIAAKAQSTPAPQPDLAPGLYAVFHTSEGDITAQLFEKNAPHAVALFIGLAQGVIAWKDPVTGAPVKRPLYDNITFHRVIRGEMIQSGDPTGTSAHNCGLHVPDEFLPGLIFNRPGRLAIANSGAPDSGGCQFFITDGPAHDWDGHYTIFGEVIAGQDVVSRISHAPLHGEKPIDPVKLTHVTIKRVSKLQK